MSDPVSQIVWNLLWIAGLLLIAGFVWLISRWKNGRKGALPPDRPDIPYRAYTMDFDVVVAGHEVRGALTPTDHVPAGTKIVRQADRIAAAQSAFRDAEAEGVRNRLSDCLRGLTGKTAVVLLIDQSGSMRDRIVPVAGHVLMLSEEFARANVEFAVLGFTTTSWKGGQPREKWIAAGRPEYPGRLCPLLHIVYQGFGAPLEHLDWEAMLDPKALRENIDGEALAWAADLLRGRAAPDKRLILLSDGAPVDDSTLLANGSRFLVQHLETTVAGLQAAGDLRLATVTIEYDRLESDLRTRIDDAADFLPAFADLMERMNNPEGSGRPSSDTF